jgi:hypothetical protein
MIKNFELYERKITRELNPIGDFLYHKFFDKSGYRYRTIKEIDDKNFYTVLINFYVPPTNNFLRLFTPKDFSLFTEFYNFVEKYAKVDFGIGSEIEIFINFFDKSKVEEFKELPEFKEWLTKTESEVKQYLADREFNRTARKYNL